MKLSTINPEALVCPHCSAYSLHSNSQTKIQELGIEHYHCDNCGFDISDEEI